MKLLLFSLLSKISSSLAHLLVAPGRIIPSCPLRWSDPIIHLFLDSKNRIQILTDVLSAVDLKWISGYVSIKEKHSPALWWHQDWWCWDHPISYRPMASQIALLCYLNATDERNGALRVLPGSHQHSLPIHAVLPEPHTHSNENLDSDHIAMLDHPDQMTLCLSAGDAVVIDYRLLHGTHGNITTSRRDCVLLSFTPSWCELPEEIRAHLISHPAQPSKVEPTHRTVWQTQLLPQLDGIPRDLSVNRMAPSHFRILVE